MNRHNSPKGVPVIECIDKVRNTYVVRYMFEDEDNDQVSYYETKVDHKPDLLEIKDIVLSKYNEDITNKIISGFKWIDPNNVSHDVWLSRENQSNYQTTYNLIKDAVSSGSENQLSMLLPFTVKFGDDDNVDLYSFTEFDTLQDFYFQCVSYIRSCYEEGWRIKQGIDWNPYIDAVTN